MMLFRYILITPIIEHARLKRACELVLTVLIVLRVFMLVYKEHDYYYV